MGYTVLYIAFGIVALWLLGEVLLQYKARLRWRLLAFAGFLCVVAGVLISQVIVIGLGAAAFAVGQTYVTLSFRRGFSAGWAVKRPDEDGAGTKRRRGTADRQDPTLEVSDLEPGESGYGDQAAAYNRESASYNDDEYDRDDVFTPARSAAEPTAAESTAVYEPQPLPDDTGSYGIYNDNAYTAANDPSYANAGQAQDQYATAAQGADQAYAYDYSGYDQQQYGYDTTGQQQYAAYSDPYIGTQTYGGGYDATYGQYAQQGYGQDQYATGSYGGETPAGGVWVPQQRTDETYGGELPQEQPYPYQDNNGQGQAQGQAQGNGYDEQYRF
ncbi:SCO2102 family sporulation regulator [Streptomyces sp. NBC_00366]|uniref:SCO2102 family sporulation regulator n=1 Tax=Streptomyces sp. NBC_00366 TaxID=2975727 RepID=UPI002E26A561